MAPVVGVQTIANRKICRALHWDIQSGVDAQASFVHGFGSVRSFEVFANFFEEVRSQVVARILYVQT